MFCLDTHLIPAEKRLSRIHRRPIKSYFNTAWHKQHIPKQLHNRGPF